MFPSRHWGKAELASYCERTWGVSPNSGWWEAWFNKVRSSSRIIFSNGLIDPWRGGGVLSNLSESIVAVHVPRGAHIYDLAGSHPGDTAEVIVARRQIQKYLEEWLK